MVEYRKDILPSGLTVVTERVPGIRSVTIGVWVKVGSRHEREGELGLAHFLEHMMFKGTKNRDARAIALSLESVGGHLDAFTSKEYSCYYSRVLDEFVPQAVDVLSDILINSVFEPDKIELEKQVVLEEIKSLNDTPDDLIHDLFTKTIWDGHPLGTPILGTDSTITKFNRDIISRFNRNMYTADRVVIAAAGNVSHDELLALVEKHFTFPEKGWTRNDAPPPNSEARESFTAMKISQTHICLGCPTFPFKHKDRYPLLALNAILGGGMSSRLFQIVREEKALAYNVYSYIDFLRDAGLFGVYLGVDPSHAQKAVDLVKEEILRLGRDGITREELDGVKSQLKGNLIIGLESTSNRMNRLAKLEIYLNEYNPLEKTIKEIDSIEADDIVRLAREIINPDRFSITLLGPDKNDFMNVRV